MVLNSMQLEFTIIELVNRGANGAILFERVQVRSELLKLKLVYRTANRGMNNLDYKLEPKRK